MQDIILDSGQKRRYLADNDSRLNKIVRGLLLALVAGLLWGLDFILYVRSGSFSMTGGGWSISVLSALMSIVLSVSLVVAVMSFFTRLQRLLFSLLCSVWIWGFMSQFLQIDKSQYLTVFLTPLVGYDAALLTDGYSHWIVAGVVFVAMYIISKRFSKKSLVYLAGILFFILTSLWISEKLLADEKKPLAEIYTSNDDDFSEKDKKIVFLFMPNLSSYGAIGKSSGRDMQKNDRLSKVELGFFLKHGFVVYPNAYVVNDNKDANLTEILNILDNKSFDKHILNNVGLEKLWKFKSPQRAEIFLKDNQMQDVFRKAGYKISAYQNQNIELCKKNNQYTVDRCVNKFSLPTAIDDAVFSEKEKTALLLKQWLSSLTVFQNDAVMSVVKYIFGRESVQAFSLPYDRLYVVDSVRVLQKLLEDLATDKGAGAYFVYLDFPDNLLIYDEGCRVRPLNRWRTLNPKVKMLSASRNTGEYNEQVLCFWGQMEELMSNLEKTGIADHLTIIMQGISGKQFAVSDSLNFIEKFKEQKSVLTAIRDSRAKFGVNNRVCNSKDILRTYLFNAKKCVEFDGLAIAGNSREALRANLGERKITKKALPEAAAFYEDWLSKRKKLFRHLDLNLKKTQENQTKKPVDKNALQAGDAVKTLVDGLHENERKEEIETGQNETEIDVEDIVSANVVETEDVPLEYSESKTEDNSQEKPEVVQEKASEGVESDVPEKENSNSETGNETRMPETNHEDSDRTDAVETQPVQEIPSESLKQEKQNQNIAEEVSDSKGTSSAAVMTETQGIVTSAETSSVAEKKETEVSQPVSETEISDIQPTEAPVQAPVDRAQTDDPPVSADFLIDGNEEGEEWELDPAKALGVSGDENPAPVEKIIVKVK